MGVTVRVPKWLLAVLAIVLVGGLAAGAYVVGRSSSSHAKTTSVRSNSAQRVRAWKASQGQDWAIYGAQYKQGFYAACDDVFLLSGVRGGVLRDSTGRDYSADDCHAAFAHAFGSEKPPFSVPTDPAKAGQMNGGASGCAAMVVKTNGNLKGVTPAGKTLTLSLDYCNGHYQQYPGPFLDADGPYGVGDAIGQ